MRAACHEERPTDFSREVMERGSQVDHVTVGQGDLPAHCALHDFLLRS
jgi:hypothetical protein